MTHKLFFIAAFAGFAAATFAQEKRSTLVFEPGATVPARVQAEVNPAASKPDDSVTKIVETFFGALQKNQIDLAYEQLTRGTKIAEKPQEIATLKSKTQQAIEMFGDVQGAERIAVQNVGSHLLSVTYLSIGKNFPLRWRFYFYRAGDKWRLIDIRVDDRLIDMFDEPEKAPPQSPN